MITIFQMLIAILTSFFVCYDGFDIANAQYFD